MTAVRRTFGILLLLSAWLLAGCRADRPLHLEAPELVEVTLAGKDGHGTVSAALSDAGRARILGLEADAPPSDDVLAEREALADRMTFSFSPERGLRENDRVTVTMHTEPEAWAEAGVDLKVFPWTVTVHDLAPPDPLDVRSGIALIAEGYSGSGRVRAVNPALDDEIAPFVTYTVTPDHDLGNGDVVQVSVTVRSEPLGQLGYRPADLSPRQMRVEGLTELTVIDPLERMEVVFRGYDGDGTATVVDTGVPAHLTDLLTVELLPTDRLTNGDTLRATVICDAAELRTAGYSLARHSRDLTVTDLVPYDTIDPFQGLRARYSGISGRATARLTATDLPEALDGHVTLHIANPTGLSNGDRLRVEADADTAALRAAGVRLSANSITLPVSGLQELPTDLRGYDLTDLLADSRPALDVLIDRELLTPNSWQSRRTQSEWSTQVTAEPTAGAFLRGQPQSGDNALVVIYTVTIDGRISRYRRGLFERYGRTATESATVSVALEIPGLIFRDGRIESAGSPEWLGFDPDPDRLTDLIAETAANDRRSVHAVTLP